MTGTSGNGLSCVQRGTANAPATLVPVQNTQQMTGTSGNGLSCVQRGIANAPATLIPVQNTQQMTGTSGNGLSCVQVPANQVLSGSTQGNTSSQEPQVTVHPSGSVF